MTGSGGSCRGLTCVSLMTRDVDASSRTCRHLRVHVGGLSAQVSSPFQSGYVGFAGVDLEEFLIGAWFAGILSCPGVAFALC